MAAADVFYIKSGDQAPGIGCLLQYANGLAHNLSGCTVKFQMRLVGAIAYKVSNGAAIVTPATGEVRYDWGATDTDTPGTYEAEWEVTLADTRTVTFPNDGYLTVEVTEEVD